MELLPKMGLYEEAVARLPFLDSNSTRQDYWEAFESMPCHENVLVLAALMAFDILIGHKTKARWFAVHAFANLLVVIAGLNAVWTTLKDPLHASDGSKYTDGSFGGNASRYPCIITNSVHLYHMLAFPLTGADYFHHLVFLPTIGASGQYYSWGPISAFMGFFVSGLPGGIDYFMLVLVKHGIVASMDQKHLSACLNVYLRGPCILVVAFILYLGVTYDLTLIPLYVSIPVGLLSILNALYYTKQSVSNYAISHALRHSMDQTHPLDKSLMKIIKEPQNNFC